MTPKSCPRCKQPLSDARGPLSEHVCATCTGRFLEPSGVERLVHEEMGYDVAFLRELTGHFAGPKLPCPQCHSNMSPLRLRGEASDYCSACGGLWLDPGELGGVSDGRYREPPAPKPRPEVDPGPRAQPVVDFETEVAKVRAGMWQTPGMDLEEPEEDTGENPWVQALLGVVLLTLGINLVVQGERMRTVECTWSDQQRTCTFDAGNAAAHRAGVEFE